jgi:poly-gamma-glutamate capsule biosynthesis protein CapA/YwtB (metallophosphatase superfamily)
MERFCFLLVAAFSLTSLFTQSACNNSSGTDNKKELISTLSNNSTGPDTATTNAGSGTTPVLTFAFAGDTMLARKVATVVQSNAAGNYQYPFQKVSDYFNSCDFTCLNLESMITNVGTADAAKASQGNALRADPAAINGLTYCGISAVSIANDHAFDYGRAGFEDCLKRLKSANIPYVGGGYTFDEAYSAKIFNVKGTRVALIGFTLVGDETTIRAQKDDFSQGLTAQSGVAWFYGVKYCDMEIVNARAQADIVVVFFCDGTEYATVQNLEQDTFEHQCIDQGADLVIGLHPHVVQPVMKYHNGYLAYSVGNFVWDESSNADKHGLILEVKVQNKKIIQVNRKNILINSNYQPVIQ